MKAVVIKAYERPYDNPISVSAGEPVTPDFGKTTDVAGWVWCIAEDGRAGWTPERWLVQRGGAWLLGRDFNAIELTVAPGAVVDVALEESGFFWVTTESGERGWIPCENVAVSSEGS